MPSIFKARKYIIEKIDNINLFDEIPYLEKLYEYTLTMIIYSNDNIDFYY